MSVRCGSSGCRRARRHRNGLQCCRYRRLTVHGTDRNQAGALCTSCVACTSPAHRTPQSYVEARCTYALKWSSLCVVACGTVRKGIFPRSRWVYAPQIGIAALQGCHLRHSSPARVYAYAASHRAAAQLSQRSSTRMKRLMMWIGMEHFPITTRMRVRR